MTTTERNPYVGARTFKPEESDLFFGREREAFDLLSLVISDNLVLFYAQSGAGKSSLINTRLIPGLLKEREFKIFPVGRLRRDEVSGGEAKNVYTYNLLSSLSPHQADQSALAQLSLSDYLEHVKFNEEDRYFYYDEKSDGNIFTESEPYPYKYVIIIDQFEELFTTHEEKWQSRADFFNQLAAAMKKFPRLWVVLVMREDYIAYLDPYVNLLPGRLRTRYYMQRLSTDRAVEAVEGPAAKFDRPFVEGVAERLIEDLSGIKVRMPDNTLRRQPGQFVEPVQLQVVCSSLWEKLPSDVQQITQDHLDQYVENVDQALGSYYEERVKTVAKGEVAKRNGVTERNIREWFGSKLITADGIRNMIAQERDRESGGLNDDVVQEFVERGDLVRAENRGGATFYELTHDRLVEPILERNKIWFNENLSPLQRQAALWQDQGQNDTWLLSDQALSEVEQWAKEHQDELTNIEKEFLKECQTKQKAREQRQELEAQQQKLFAEQELSRQRRIRLNLLILASIFTLTLAVFGFIQAGRARSAQATAEYNLVAAQTAQADAKINQELADSNAATAVANQEKAESQAKILFSNSLAAQSNAFLAENFQVSTLLGIEAYKISPDTIQSRGALLNSAQANPRLRQILDGYSSAGNTVVFSPDGKTFASGTCSSSNPEGVCTESQINLWNTETLQPIGQPLTGHTGAVISIAFNPDGKTLASSSYDTTIRLWDVETHELIGQLIGHSNAISSVAFSPDGSILASSSYDNTILLWDVNTLQPIGQPLSGHANAVASVAFSPDGRILASGSYDNSIILWDVGARQTMGQRLTGHTGTAISVSFSADGEFLASGSCSKINEDKCTEGEVILWDMKTRPPTRQTLLGHTDFVTSVAFSPDGKTLVSGSRDKTILLWNVDALQPMEQPLTGHSNSVTSVAFSPDGKILASSSEDKSVILWNMETRLPTAQTLVSHKNPIISVAFNSNGKTLASGSCSALNVDKCTRGEIILWDAETRQPIGKSLTGHTDFISSVAFSPDGRTLASGSYDTTVILWDTETRQPIGERLRGHTDVVISVAFSPDGKTLASSSYDNTIILWDVETRQPIGEPLSAHTDAVSSVAFSPDGKTLASGSYDNTIILWDVETRQPIGEPLSAHINSVTSVAFSPDGRILASGSWDNTIIMWELATGKSIGQLTGHSGAVSSIAFSSEGKTFASGSYDSTILLWDVDTLQPIGQPLSGHTDAVSSISFNPDGRTLVSGSYDTTIIVWDIDPLSLIEIACQRASRNFTRSEWERYFPGEGYRKTCDQWPLEPEAIATPIQTQVSAATATKTPAIVLLTTDTAIPTPTLITVGTAPALFRVVNVTEEDRLNIRAGPGLKYDIIGKIPRDGRGIQITGEGVQADNTIWVPIIYNDISGWVNSFFLSKEE